MTHFPFWLHSTAILSLAVAGACAAFIAGDEARRPQPAWIMNLVWPLTALFGSIAWLALYLRSGRAPTGNQAGHERRGEQSMLVAVAIGASHCGAGCALGDLIAEWAAFAFPGIAVAVGWGSLFADKMFAVWVLDYLVAFALGIAFQYFTITPMRDVSAREGLWQALKADAASITAWQIGMYGFVAVAQLLWLRPVYGGAAAVDTPEFWLIMQVAMLCGFGTAYPVNWLLIRTGVKEKM